MKLIKFTASPEAMSELLSKDDYASLEYVLPDEYNRKSDCKFEICDSSNTLKVTVKSITITLPVELSADHKDRFIELLRDGKINSLIFLNNANNRVSTPSYTFAGKSSENLNYDYVVLRS